MESKIKIKEEWAAVSFENIQKLRQQKGTKFNEEEVFENNNCQKKKHKQKNRPLTLSSKVKPPPLGFRPNEIIQPRDPRFDSLCGSFDKKRFQRNYKFINEIRDNELVELKKKLKKEHEPKQIGKLKFLIQRMENQKRENQKLQVLEDKSRLERQVQINDLKSGRQPVYKKKSTEKVENLIQKFEDLKKQGKLKKHIERHRKKGLKKDRMVLESF